MGKTLVIVESPGKVKTIQKYLGKDYAVASSIGHIRDLPRNQMGIQVDKNYKPRYITIPGKMPIIKELQAKAQKYDKVLLATDPDREGEAISWHLAQVLKMDMTNDCRIVFNEITKKAVQKAVDESRGIDLDLVDAQQARRILDRLVGYTISPLLWAKIKKGLSAGRVQSVATRLICEKEREIQNFVSEEYWTLKGIFSKDKSQKFEAAYFGKNKSKKLPLPNQETVNDIVKELQKAEFSVLDVKKGKRKQNPNPPHITSTLQQEASNIMGMSPNQTMRVAQQLYEGIEIPDEGSVGLITYMRTDSNRISQDALGMVREFIDDKYGKDYLPETPNYYKGKKNAQDAHEAIRPTDINKTPESLVGILSKQQLGIYRIIYNRFVASQMKPAQYETMNVFIKGGEHILKANGSRRIFDGFQKVYEYKRKTEDVILPELFNGDKLQLHELLPKQNFTSPPPRYTEASLIKILEELGIGRPSTYAPTISTILERAYVEKDNKQLAPTELGFIVNDMVIDNFEEIFNYTFTAHMEENLDEVEAGKVKWQQVIDDFYKKLTELIKDAEGKIEKVKIEDPVSDVKCEKCGRMMVIKTGRYGKFLACPGFPDCENIKPIVNKIGVKCPKCNVGDVLLKKSKKGRKFYGCSEYPNCDFVSWAEPTDKKCPECGAYMTVKKLKNKNVYTCSNKECGYKEEENK